MVLPLLFRLYRSPFGLALQTLREDERAARAMGVDTNKLALKAMVVADGVAGLAGALYAAGGNRAYQVMTPEISFDKGLKYGSLDV